MDIWAILNIAKTDDKNEIRRAYRTMLRKVNPEDDPEGFKQLREAYERALRGEDPPGKSLNRQAEEAEGKKEDADAAGAMQAVESLFRHFFHRIDPKMWERLLDTDYFTMLDTSETGMMIILTNLMKYPYVPKDVLTVLNCRYRLTERADELSDRVPLAFFQYLERRLVSPDQIEMRLIRGPENADYDGFIEDYLNLRRAVMRGQKAEQAALLRKLERMDIQYPGLDEQYTRHLLQTGRTGEADRLSRILAEAYPFFDTMLLRADVLQILGHTGKMRDCLAVCGRLKPGEPALELRLARVEAEEGNYAQSRDRLVREVKKHPYDIVLRSELASVTAGLAEQLKGKLEASPDDPDLKMELGKAYYQARMFREAIAVFGSFHPGDEQLPEYLNYMGSCHLYIHKEKDAILAFETWLKVVDALPDTPENQKEKKQRGRTALLMGTAYLESGDLDAAERWLDQVEPEEPEDEDTLTETRIELLYRKGDYSACIRLCRELAEKKHVNYMSMLYRAKCALKRGNAEEAVFYAAQAMDIYPYMVDPYEVIIKVNILQGNLAEAGKILRKYERLGIPSVTAAYFRAMIAKEENRPAEAYRLLAGYEDKLSSPETCDLHHPEEFYILKGEILEALKDPHKALAAYLEAERLRPENDRIQGKLGVLLAKLHRFDEAEKRLSRQIEKKPEPLYYLTRGMCYREMNEDLRAREDYLRVAGETRIAAKTILFIADQLREMMLFRDAEGLYRRAMEKTAASGERRIALFGLARTLAERKKGDEARSVLMELVEGQAVTAELKLVLAGISMREGRIREAEDMLQSLLLYEQRGREEIYRALARLYYRSDQPEKLEALCAAVSGEKMDSTSMYLLLGKLFLWRGEWKRAEGVLLLAEQGSVRGPESAMLLAFAASHQFAGRGRMNRYLNLAGIRLKALTDSCEKAMIRTGSAILRGMIPEAEEQLSILIPAQAEDEYNERLYQIYLLAGMLAELRRDGAKALMYYEKALSAYGKHALLEKKCEELKKK